MRHIGWRRETSVDDGRVSRCVRKRERKIDRECYGYHLWSLYPPGGILLGAMYDGKKRIRES